MVSELAPVGQEEEEREDKEADDLRGAKRVLAEDLEDVGEEGDPRAEEDEADEVERVGLLRVIVGEVAVDEVQAGDPDREIHEEDHPPGEVLDDEAAGQRAQHRPDQRGD